MASESGVDCLTLSLSSKIAWLLGATPEGTDWPGFECPPGLMLFPELMVKNTRSAMGGPLSGILSLSIPDYRVPGYPS